MFSTVIPDIEIHLSNEPIALIISGEYIKPYKIISKGNYFIVNERRTRGIYTIKGRGLNWGKTKVYFYHVEETNPIDPILTHELNHYIHTNELTKIKVKDVKHGSRLRVLGKLKDETNYIDRIKNDEANKLENLDTQITSASAKINKTETDIKENYNSDVSISPVKKSYMLLEHLRESKQIDEVEFESMTQKLENHELDFNTLINELREAHVIRVYEPLDVNVESYINDLGSQNARELAGFVQDLRNNKKGLADMTSKPVTSFISAGVILAAGIVALLAIVMLPQVLPGITGGGGNKTAGFNLNPFTMFGGGNKVHLILGLTNHISNFILGLFI
jgi:hypothetical protein